MHPKGICGFGYGSNRFVDILEVDAHRIVALSGPSRRYGLHIVDITVLGKLFVNTTGNCYCRRDERDALTITANERSETIQLP